MDSQTLTRKSRLSRNTSLSLVLTSSSTLHHSYGSPSSRRASPMIIHLLSTSTVMVSLQDPRCEATTGVARTAMTSTKISTLVSISTLVAISQSTTTAISSLVPTRRQVRPTKKNSALALNNTVSSRWVTQPVLTSVSPLPTLTSLFGAVTLTHSSLPF